MSLPCSAPLVIFQRQAKLKNEQAKERFKYCTMLVQSEI